MGATVVLTLALPFGTVPMMTQLALGLLEQTIRHLLFAVLGSSPVPLQPYTCTISLERYEYFSEDLRNL